MTAPVEKPWEFFVYKTNIGIFFRNPWGSSYDNYVGQRDNAKLIRINGVSPVAHTYNGYFFLEGVFSIDKFERMGHARKELSHMELIDKAYESEKIPSRYDNVTYRYDDDEECYVSDNEELNKVVSLYKPVYNTIEGDWEEKPFTVNVLGNVQVDNFSEPQKMQVSLLREDSWSRGREEVDISSVTDYYTLEKMLTPPFLLHERNCFISSDNMYRIVRDYVKKNIDLKVARITSDYDFCFTVKKVVSTKPFPIRKEERTRAGNSYKPPRYKTTQGTTKEVEVFEMTSATKKYNNYTVIEPLKAPNQRELIENLKAYLDDLMYTINLEVSECQHCSGCGHIVPKKSTN